MKDKLKDYVDGKIHYTPIMNIMINNHSKDWYVELGKYINETLDIEKIPFLDYLSVNLKEKKGIVTKIKNLFNTESSIYSSISINFLTAILDEKALRKMFGKPLFHDEFGEGFEGEYDEETDEYGEPGIKEAYASYFINIGGTELHIGYDHRGTSIEIETDGEFDISHNEFLGMLIAQNVFDCLKKVVDLYKLKN